MFELLEKSHDNVVAARIDGKLVHADYQNFVPMLEEIIAEHGSLRCYCEMTGFKGISAHALWDEIKFDTKHCKDVERCAVVGDPSWHQWMTSFSKFIFRRADVKYFPVDKVDAAWTWLEEGLPTGQIGTGAESDATSEGTQSPGVDTFAHSDQ